MLIQSAYKCLRSRIAQAFLFLREFSGELALERRMQMFDCEHPACAAKAAMSDLANERSRCC
jgi:hypothetical protein